MNITGIEVIRRNPGVAIGVVAGEKIELTYGDTLRVNVSFDYRGLAGSATLYGSIGQRKLVIGFDEILHSEVSIDLPESRDDFIHCERSVDIGITSDISPGTDYDIEAKIEEYMPETLVGIDNVIDIVGIPPVYELIQHTVYPWSYTFEGDAEICTFEFKLTPEQIPAYAWLGERIINSFTSKLEEEGSRLLELRVYEDTTPMFWTNYRVEVTATASPLAWNLIIIGVLAVLFIVAIYFTIKVIDEVFFKRKPLDEETKKTFARETLIAMILDLEPETPPETLEGKSDQELRDLVNRLLAEVAPPVSWWPLAILAGVVVVGAGAAIALSAAKPKE